MQKRILITNIQRFSIHDGPGVRTTVFLKGCSLRCPWCCNPENLTGRPEKFIRNGIEGIYGKYYQTDELVEAILRDRSFYEGTKGILQPADWNIESAEMIARLPGGITLSGGECLLQIEELIPVLEKLHMEGIHIAAETALFVPPDHLDKALNDIDFFYVDVKMLDPAGCRNVLRGDVEMFIENFDTLLKWEDNGQKKPVVVRIPVIGGYTDKQEDRDRVKELLGKYRDKILKIELIKEHKLGENKYLSLGMKHEYHGVTDSLMDRYMDELETLGIPIEGCKI